jgi:hypothetical protein
VWVDGPAPGSGQTHGEHTGVVKSGRRWALSALCACVFGGWPQGPCYGCRQSAATTTWQPHTLAAARSSPRLLFPRHAADTHGGGAQRQA